MYVCEGMRLVREAQGRMNAQENPVWTTRNEAEYE